MMMVSGAIRSSGTISFSHRTDELMVLYHTGQAHGPFARPCLAVP